MIVKLGNIESLEYVSQAAEGALSFMAGKDEYFVPVEGHVDAEAEKARIEKELTYLRGFLQSVLKKLENKRFVESAPVKVVEAERKKQADAEEKISTLEAQLKQLTR